LSFRGDATASSPGDFRIWCRGTISGMTKGIEPADAL
jgi:hypothetical protein